MDTLTAKQLNALFSSGEASAVEITKQALAKIDKLNLKLSAFLSVFEERSLKSAALLDEKKQKGEPLGRLAGVPIAIKDNIAIEGEITSCASKFLENYRSPYDATVVRLLEEDGAILIGKTNMDEFAMGASGTHSAFSPTRNPWDLDCVPGGSSSGSAAAVSGRLCPLSLGSDTGGSIRQPAAFTGIVGFKPTYGRISRYGLVAFASSFDQIGPFAQTVEDVALVMEAVSRHCERDSTSLNLPPNGFDAQFGQSLKGTKIGIPWGFLEDLKGEARQNFEKSVATLTELGAETVDVDLSLLKYGIGIYYILTSAEASTNLARYDGIRYGKRAKEASSLEEIYEMSRQEGFGFEVKNRIMLGTYVLSGGFKDAYYSKAQKVRALIIQQIRRAFENCNLFAFPTTAGTAFTLDGMRDPLDEYLQDLYTVAAPIAGLPAISVPSGFSTEKKPFGLQLVGPQLHDASVLGAARAFEQATRFGEKIPGGFS